MINQQSNLVEQFNQTSNQQISFQKPTLKLKKFLITSLISLILLLTGAAIFFISVNSNTKKLDTKEVKYIKYRNIIGHINISFQYPSTLHLVKNQQNLSDPNVCIDIPPSIEYTGFDLCQRHIFEPMFYFISNEGKSVIEISDLNPNHSINDLKTLWNAFLKQYFSEYSFDKQDLISLEPNKLPPAVSEERESFASIYSSSNPNAPVIVFFPIFGIGRIPYGWVLVLKDKTFQQEFDVIVKSFNLNNTVQIVKTNLTTGNSTFLDSPLYIEDFQFHDFYNKKILLSDFEKLQIFNENDNTSSEVFKFTEINKSLEIPRYMYSWINFVFDRKNPNIIYGLIEDTIFQYNIQTKETKIIYKGELPLRPFRLYPPVEKYLLIASAYGDAGCSFKGYSVLNLDNKELKEGWLESHCAHEENLNEKSISVSPDGIYVLISSTKNNYSYLYLYNNLTGKKVLLWSGAVTEIEGEMIGTYRFRFYNEDGDPKVYNLQTQKFESFSESTTKMIRVRHTPIKYNDNGFIYERGKYLYYLDYMNNKLIPLYGVDAEKILFLTNSNVISWK